MSTKSADANHHVTHPHGPRSLSFWVTEQAVYGVILVGGLILVAGSHGDASWWTFWTVVVTVAVFWLAHVFAGIVAHPSVLRGKTGGLKKAIRESVNNAHGLWVASAIPCMILALGALGWIYDGIAILLAMLSGIAVLFAIGYLAFWRAGYGILGRFVGATITGTFGLLLFIVKALVH